MIISTTPPVTSLSTHTHDYPRPYPPSKHTANMASPVPEKKYTMAVKAYKNPDFLNSGHARFIRVMCEYEVRLVMLMMGGAWELSSSH